MSYHARANRKFRLVSGAVRALRKALFHMRISCFLGNKVLRGTLGPGWFAQQRVFPLSDQYVVREASRPSVMTGAG